MFVSLFSPWIYLKYCWSGSQQDSLNHSYDIVSVLRHGSRLDMHYKFNLVWLITMDGCCVFSISIMKRNSIRWWSSNPPVSTKGTITSHLYLTHWAQKRQRHMKLEIQVLAWDRHKKHSFPGPTLTTQITITTYQS